MGKGPLSKWLQFEISCATEVPLVDCKAWLTSIKAIEGTTLGEELINEPMRCIWSNYRIPKEVEEIPRVTIQPAVVLRACLLKVYDGENILYLTIVPSKARLNKGIQRAGSYRINVVVTAEDVPSASSAFIFKWADFNHVTVSPE